MESAAQTAEPRTTTKPSRMERFVVGVILLEIPIQIDIYLNYHYELASIGALGGWNVSIRTFALLVLFAWWVASVAVGRRPQFDRPFIVSLPLLIYMIVLGVSVLVAGNATFALFELFLVAQAFLLYVYMANRIRTRDDVLFVVTMLIAGLALQGMIMIGLRVIGRPIQISMIHARIDPGMRVAGTIGAPNAAGSYLTLLLPPAFSVLMTSSPKRLKRLAFFALCVGAAGLVLTQSRGAWIGCSAAMVFLIAHAWRRRFVSSRLLGRVVLVGLVGALIFGGQVVDRLTEDDKGAAYSRIPLANISWGIISEHPLLGVGANNFVFGLLESTRQVEFRSLGFVYVAHCKYLVLWAETGIFGLLAFVAFLLATLREGFRIVRFNDPLLSPLSLGVVAGVVGLMVHMFSETLSLPALINLLFVVAGLLTSIHFIVAQPRLGELSTT